MVRNEEGTYSYMARAHNVPLDQVNMSEKEAFQSGRKLVAVISNAASTGISLQARLPMPPLARHPLCGWR